MTNPIDRRNKFSVIYFCGESFLSEGALQSTAISRYARGFAGQGQSHREAPGTKTQITTMLYFLESLP